MRLDEVSEAFQALGFPAKGERAHPERATVLAARSSVEAAVVDDEFLTDCIALELQLIERDHIRRGLVPFFTLPGLGVRFAFGYWPPGGTPGPHEHTAWTITAVCRNELEVLTYNRDESYRRRELVPKNRFPAAAGKVGYIFEPCIHEPMNKSADWSLSLHVISPRDGEHPGDYEGPLPGLNPRRNLLTTAQNHPYASVIAARRRMKRVHVLARTLAAMDVAQAPSLLLKCATLGSPATHRLIARASSESPSSNSICPPRIFRRTHEDLVLSHRCVGEMVALDVETPKGPVEELVIDSHAHEAIAFVTRARVFEARAMPGNISDDERMMIAEALEETGLFMEVAQ